MKPEEFAEAMRAIYRSGRGDHEMTHAAADALMEEVLRELGYGEGIDFLDSQTRWYA